MNPTKNTALVVIPMAALLNGCQNGLLHPKVTEGVIEYALSFPEYDPNGLMAGMLPEKTTLAFTENRQAAELSAGMGVFRTALIADNEKREGEYRLSVMSKKLVAHLGETDVDVFNKESVAFSILYIDQVDTIAGYPCKKAVAVYEGIDKPEIDLWYTDRIAMENPNWFGPFSEIPGVLLSYEMVQYGMRMRLDATSVVAGPVDPARFKPKDGYTAVSPEVLHHELSEVISTFSL